MGKTSSITDNFFKLRRIKMHKRTKCTMSVWFKISREKMDHLRCFFVL